MITLLKNTTIALFAILIINSCGSDTNGSSNPPVTDFAPKTAGGFEDTFTGRTITSPSGSKVTILKNKQGRYFIYDQLLSGSYTYSYITKNTITIKHTINDIICNQTLTFTSQFDGEMDEKCTTYGANNNINVQAASGKFNIGRKLSEER